MRKWNEENCSSGLCKFKQRNMYVLKMLMSQPSRKIARPKKSLFIKRFFPLSRFTNPRIIILEFGVKRVFWRKWVLAIFWPELALKSGTLFWEVKNRVFWGFSPVLGGYPFLAFSAHLVKSRYFRRRLVDSRNAPSYLIQGLVKIPGIGFSGVSGFRGFWGFFQGFWGFPEYPDS